MGLQGRERSCYCIIVITPGNIMKNSVYLCRSIITGMDISLLTTTNDIEQLRAMALAMVQKLVTEKNAELTARDQLSVCWKRRFCWPASNASGAKPKCCLALQRQLFEEDTLFPGRRSGGTGHSALTIRQPWNARGNSVRWSDSH